MKKDISRSLKKNCFSSNFLYFKGFNNIHDEINGEGKESNSGKSKIYSKSIKNNNVKLTLKQFMENQNKKHLSTKFSHKDVEIFLKEKDKAMKEIIIEEDSIKSNEEEIINKHSKKETKKINIEKSKNFKSENNIFQNDNKTSHNLIFHGTFGIDEYSKLMPHHHHHHHHHHNHRHHHHHNSEEINNNIEGHKIKENMSFEC